MYASQFEFRTKFIMRCCLIVSFNYKLVKSLSEDNINDFKMYPLHKPQLHKNVKLRKTCNKK